MGDDREKGVIGDIGSLRSVRLKLIRIKIRNSSGCIKIRDTIRERKYRDLLLGSAGLRNISLVLLPRAAEDRRCVYRFGQLFLKPISTSPPPKNPLLISLYTNYMRSSIYFTEEKTHFRPHLRQRENTLRNRIPIDVTHLSSRPFRAAINHARVPFSNQTLARTRLIQIHL